MCRRLSFLVALVAGTHAFAPAPAHTRSRSIVVVSEKVGATLARRRQEFAKEDWRSTGWEINPERKQKKPDSAEDGKYVAWNENEKWLARVAEEGVGNGWYAAGLRLTEPNKRARAEFRSVGLAPRRPTPRERRARQAEIWAQRGENIFNSEIAKARRDRIKQTGLSAASAAKAKTSKLAWNDNKKWMARVAADGVGNGWYAAGLRLTNPRARKPVDVKRTVTTAKAAAAVAPAVPPAPKTAVRQGGFSFNPFKKKEAKVEKKKAEPQTDDALAPGETMQMEENKQTEEEVTASADPMDAMQSSAATGDFIPSNFEGFKDGYAFKSDGEKGKGYYKK